MFKAGDLARIIDNSLNLYGALVEVVRIRKNVPCGLGVPSPYNVRVKFLDYHIKRWWDGEYNFRENQLELVTLAPTWEI